MERLLEARQFLGARRKESLRCVQAVVVRLLPDMVPGSPQTITGIMVIRLELIGDLRSWGASVAACTPSQETCGTAYALDCCLDR
jgi:hypothetical protein